MSDLTPHGAVLDPTRAARAFRLARHPPGPDLAPFVRHYWFIRWDLRGTAPHRQSTLTVPAVNAVVEATVDSVSGVRTRRFDRVLADAGAVFGVLFRPAGFHPFWRRSMHLLADRALPFAEVLAAPVAPVRELAFGGADDAAIVAAFEALLAAEGPSLSADAAEVGRWVDLAERDPAIGRAELLAERAGVGLRTLQRGLREYVGVGPKQLLRRFRLLEAAEALSRGRPVDHTELALALGYADQAHFVRDFSAVIGRPPGRYAAEQRGG